MTTHALAGFLTADAPGATIEGGSPVEAILDAVRQHLGMEIAFASRFVDGRREFTHVRSDIPLPLGPGDSEPLEQTFCHHILAGRLPELIHDAADYPAAQAIPITRALPVGSHINVPLRLSDGSIHGTFCCVSRTADRSLNARDLSTLRAFADIAAVQIERELNETRERDAAMSRITGAVAHGQPAIVYQPIHSLVTGAVVGVEALARFPDRSDRPPSAWFNEAAALGLGTKLEVAAVRAAIAGLPYIPSPVYLAVNASPATAISGLLEPILAAAPPNRIVLELTEHAEVEDYPGLRAALDRLRRHARIAIDDVGAGYSSLRHILDLAPDILKLDLSLVRDVDHDPARRALIGAMVAFGGEIGATLVAEGVEQVRERDALRTLGVGHAQGWYFSRPMAPVKALQYLLTAGGEGNGAPLRDGPAGPLTRRAGLAS